MPTIAVSTIALGFDCTARGAIEFTVEHGFRGLEFGSPTLWPDAMSAEDVRLVRTEAASNGIDLSIHHIHRGVAPATHDPSRRARHFAELEATLNLAYDIGARPIVVHPGPVDVPGVAPEETSEPARLEAIANLTSFLSDAVPVAERTGTVLCVENLVHTKGNVIRSYRELVQVVEAVNSPLLRITLDTGHAHQSGGLTDAFAGFAPYLRHIHVHDSDGIDDHFEIGQGAIDWSSLRDDLAGYPFTMALETQNTDDGPGGMLRSRDALRQLLGPSVG